MATQEKPNPELFRWRIMSLIGDYVPRLDFTSENGWDGAIIITTPSGDFVGRLLFNQHHENFKNEIWLELDPAFHIKQIKSMEESLVPLVFKENNDG